MKLRDVFVFSVPASDSALPDLSLVPPWYALGIPVHDPFRSSISQRKETNNSFIDEYYVYGSCRAGIGKMEQRVRELESKQARGSLPVIGVSFSWFAICSQSAW